MEQTVAALSHEKSADASEKVLETHLAEGSTFGLRFASLTLLLAPATAVGAAAVLTLSVEGLRIPAIATFLVSVVGLQIARRVVDARSTRKRGDS
jgi:hypothetical protein